MSWGLVPAWHKGDMSSWKMSTINCRSEGWLSGMWKPPAMKGQRCILICEGYFEWQKIEDSKQKKPFFFYFPQPNVDFKTRDFKEQNFDPIDWKGPRVLTLAALFEANEHLNPDLGPTYTFAVLTIKAHKSVAWAHDRMPVVLDENGVDKWLNFEDYKPEDVADLLKPYEGLEYHEVSQEVNSVRNDSVNCVRAVEVAQQKPEENALSNWLLKRNKVEEGEEKPLKKIKSPASKSSKK
jgi:putative SOS response-associated peptidase YedK